MLWVALSLYATCTICYGMWCLCSFSLMIWYFPFPDLNVHVIDRCENSTGLLTFTQYLLICWTKSLCTWIPEKLEVYLFKTQPIKHYHLFPISKLISYLWKNVFPVPTCLYFCCTLLSKGLESEAWSHFSCSFIQGVHVFLGMYVMPEPVCTWECICSQTWFLSQEMALISSQHAQ